MLREIADWKAVAVCQSRLACSNVRSSASESETSPSEALSSLMNSNTLQSPLSGPAWSKINFSTSSVSIALLASLITLEWKVSTRVVECHGIRKIKSSMTSCSSKLSLPSIWYARVQIANRDSDCFCSIFDKAPNADGAPSLIKSFYNNINTTFLVDHAPYNNSQPNNICNYMISAIWGIK